MVWITLFSKVRIYHGHHLKLYRVTILLHLQQNYHGHHLDHTNMMHYLDYVDRTHRMKRVASRKLIQMMRKNSMISLMDGLEWKIWKNMALIWKVKLEDYGRRRKVLFGRKSFEEDGKRRTKFSHNILGVCFGYIVYNTTL